LEEFVSLLKRIGAAFSAAYLIGAAGCAAVGDGSGPGSSTRSGLSNMQTSSVQDLPPPAAGAATKSKSKSIVAKENEVPVAAGKAPARSKPSQLAQESACVNVEQCASVLKAMIDDPDRAWINWPASATTLANGVRLFAYRSLRPKLTCSQLSTALHEVTTASVAFVGLVPSLQPGQVGRARELSGKVEVELKAERAARCDHPTGQALEVRAPGMLPTANSEGRSPPADTEVR
jgi:hypothetical protein